MSGFEPGEGWREVDQDADARPVRAEVWVQWYDHGQSRRWVREVPVPPLPTEPYTVIRATWGSEKSTDMWLTDAGTWCSQWGPYSRSDMKGVVRFEVLAEPIPAGSAVYTSEQLNAIIDGARAGTAKAVLDRANDVLDGETPWITLMTRLLREFGVTS